jgi:Fe-Mn family superoxide dismutase
MFELIGNDNWIECMRYNLSPLKYAYDALEPVFTAEMLALHHLKHHASYVNKLNELLGSLSCFAPESIDDFIADDHYSRVSEAHRDAVRFNGGGHANHTFFWNILKPCGKDNEHLPKDLEKVVKDNFGTLSMFKEKFTLAAMGHLGSGWAWLSISEKKPGALFISTTLNHDHPQMAENQTKKTFGFPIFTLDLWEHAYYLAYKNRKADYFESFWQIVDWEAVAENYRVAVAKFN